MLHQFGGVVWWSFLPPLPTGRILKVCLTDTVNTTIPFFIFGGFREVTWSFSDYESLFTSTAFCEPSGTKIIPLDTKVCWTPRAQSPQVSNHVSVEGKDTTKKTTPKKKRTTHVYHSNSCLCFLGDFFTDSTMVNHIFNHHLWNTFLFFPNDQTVANRRIWTLFVRIKNLTQRKKSDWFEILGRFQKKNDAPG